MPVATSPEAKPFGQNAVTISVKRQIELEGEFTSFMHYYGRKMVLGQQPEPFKYVAPERTARILGNTVRTEATAKLVDGEWADLMFIDFGEWWKLQKEINPELDK